MPIYTVELDGKQYDLEGDHEPSEAEARAAVDGMAPKQATPPPSSATMGMMQPSTPKGDPVAQPFGSLGIETVSDADWATKTPQEKLQGVLKAAGYAMGFGKDAVDNPKTTLAMAAAPGVIQAVSQKVPGVIEGGKRLAGISKVRAGANLETAAKAAEGVTVGTEGVGAEGLRAMEFQAAGGRMPRAASQLMQRITNPQSGDLTFEEARDFYSNLSRLSANEFGSLNPTMQRQIGLMKEALHQALTDAAGTVGAGEQYASGISEYAKAGRAAAQWENKIKPGLMTTLKRAAQLAGAGSVFEAGRRLTD